MVSGAAWRRRSPRIRRTIAAGAAVSVAAVTGILVYSTQSSASPAYRTARVTISEVARTLAVTGTVQPVHEATVSFQVAGTVANVAATPGRQVRAGQVLASLDPTTLQQTVTAAQTILAADQARLSEDEAVQTTTVTALVEPASTGTASTPVVVLAASTGRDSDTTLAAAQQAVVDAQKKADTDAETAGADLAAAETTCSTATGSRPVPGSSTTTTTAPSTTSTTTPPTTSTTTPPTTTTTAPGPGADSSSQACAAALAAALDAQSRVSGDQRAVSSSESALAKLLSSPPASTSGSSPASGAADGSGRGGSAASTSIGSNQNVTDPAALLATDQAAIDTAQANLVIAEQSLSEAQLTSPISGTVVSVGLSAGQSTAANSASSTITVIDAGSYQTMSSLTSTQVSQVTVGDRAQVLINGTTATLTGTVARVGPVAVSSSSYTYPVVIALDAPGGTIAPGSTAALSIDVAQTGEALVVPTSAVHTTAPGRSYVEVPRSGGLKRVNVSVGVAGSVYTQIEVGLSEGQTVVLADPSQPLPASSTNPTGRTFGGGFGGGGFGGGGFGGGAGAGRAFRATVG